MQAVPMGITRKDFNRNVIFSASDLMRTSFPKSTWLVESILPTGLTLLAGKPKVGKSWLMLDIALAIANGEKALGGLKTEKRDVLYLALEDNPSRIHERILKLTEEGKRNIPSNLQFVLETDTVESGGIRRIEKWISETDNPGLVIIDVFSRFMGPRQNIRDVYRSDYADISMIKDLADRHDIAVLLVHHMRKQGSRDYLDTISGSTGLSGGVDTIWVMEGYRSSQEAVLKITGRDVEEQNLLLKHSGDMRWVISGDTKTIGMNLNEVTIHSVLQASKETMSPREIADVSGLLPSTVRGILGRMVDRGYINRTTYGRYSIDGFKAEEHGQKDPVQVSHVMMVK